MGGIKPTVFSRGSGGGARGRLVAEMYAWEIARWYADS
jgi:hypothetical protein